MESRELRTGPRSFGSGYQNILRWGIYLTQVPTICSVFGRGRLSAEFAGTGGTVFDGSDLPGVSVSASLARGILL
jgi:hypothetical protein